MTRCGHQAQWAELAGTMATVASDQAFPGFLGPTASLGLSGIRRLDCDGFLVPGLEPVQVPEWLRCRSEAQPAAAQSRTESTAGLCPKNTPSGPWAEGCRSHDSGHQARRPQTLLECLLRARPCAGLVDLACVTRPGVGSGEQRRGQPGAVSAFPGAESRGSAPAWPLVLRHLGPWHPGSDDAPSSRGTGHTHTHTGAPRTPRPGPCQSDRKVLDPSVFTENTHAAHVIARCWGCFALTGASDELPSESGWPLALSQRPSRQRARAGARSWRGVSFSLERAERSGRRGPPAPLGTAVDPEPAGCCRPG